MMSCRNDGVSSAAGVSAARTAPIAINTAKEATIATRGQRLHTLLLIWGTGLFMLTPSYRSHERALNFTEGLDDRNLSRRPVRRRGLPRPYRRVRPDLRLA